MTHFPHGNRRGLTLLEVILAMVLLAGLMLTLFAFHLEAKDVRRRVGELASEVTGEQLVMERMAGELRSACTFPFLSGALQGAGDSVRFLCSQVPSARVWLEDAPDRPAPAREVDVRIVSYRLRIPRDEQGAPLRDEEGNVIVQGLERTSQSMLTAPRVEEGEVLGDVQQVEVGFLTPHVKFLALEYYTGDAWVKSWQGEDLPRAVRVTLGRSPLPEGMAVEDYLEQHETSQRVVALSVRSITARSGEVADPNAPGDANDVEDDEGEDEPLEEGGAA